MEKLPVYKCDKGTSKNYPFHKQMKSSYYHNLRPRNKIESF